MRIGVISDTHMNGYDQAFADRLAGAMGEVEIILHAGDITNLRVLDALPAPVVHAVCGNMDGSLVASELPAKKIVRAGSWRIGLIHGWGAKHDLAERVAGEFENIDCLVYGHTHQPANFSRNGVLFFNPGSAMGGRGTFGILHLENSIRGEIHRL